MVRIAGDAIVPAIDNNNDENTRSEHENKSVVVEALVISNFKSYRGKHVIGPFKRFTGVIGPNGAGKSNLMDAVSFVLGVQARHMRGSNLSDLIYRPSDSKRNINDDDDNESDDAIEGAVSKGGSSQQASVSLILRFQLTGRSIAFCRKIVRGGAQSITQIDGKTVSTEEYQKRLSDLNVMVKARNFLVFQGDVTDVARKTPADLGKLFEQISGSDAMKDEYEKYEAEVKQITSELKHETLNRQRCEAQRQDLEKEVSEVNEYRQLEKKLREARSMLLIYKLYVNEVRAGETQQKNVAAKEKAESAEQKKETQTQTIRELDANIQKDRIEKDSLSQSMERVIRNVEELETAIANATQRIDFEKKKRVELQRQLDQEYLQDQKKKQTLEENKEDLLEVEAKIKELDEEEGRAKSTEVQFTSKQKKDYQRLKQQASAVTAGLKAAEAACQAKKRTLERRLENTVVDIAEGEKQVEEAETKELSCKEFVDKCKNELETLCEELKDKEETLSEKQQVLNTMIGEESRIIDERRQLESQLNRLNAGKKEVDRMMKRRDVLNMLKETFPGSIHGPMNELFELSQRKYATAVNAALGKFAECIVVETFDVGKKAVDCLRRSRKQPLEFAPLDALSKASVDPRLHSPALRNLCRSALDCVEYDEKYDAAFKAALHDSAIVDNLTIAEQVAYTEAPRLNLRVKVITLDGEKVLKNGNITVDTSLWSGSRIDHRELKRLTDRLKEIETQLGQNGEIGEVKHSINQMMKEVGEMRNMAEIKKGKLKMWEDKKHIANRDLHQAKGLLERQQNEKPKIENELEKCEEELKRMETQVLTAEDDIFAPLAREVNVSDLRRFEEDQRTCAKTRESHRAKLNQKMVKLELTIRRLESEIDSMNPKKLENELKQIEKNLKNDEKKLEKLAQEKRGFEESIGEIKEKLGRSTAEEKTKDLKLKDEREILRKVQNEISAIHGEIKQLNARSELLYKEAVDLLRSALLDNIDLPLAKGTLGGYCRLLGLEDVMSATASQQPRTDSNGDIIMALTDGNTLDDDDEAPLIDYSTVLPKEALDSCSNSAREKNMERQFEERIGEIRTDLSKRNPNLRAKDRYDVAVAEIKAVEKKISDLEKTKDKNERLFHKIRRDRSRRFLECFNHVQKAINQIYHRLTGGHGDDDEAIGGQAYLELESGPSTHATVDCFSSGILYNVIPPLKRFSDLKRLSGGEKTMAALALLFALQSFHPAPFFVLDEIDADLDPVNVLSLANYLREAKFQVIVISHSDRVFNQADELIGIYIDPMRESSDTLSIDLSVYPRITPTLEMDPLIHRHQQRRPISTTHGSIG